MAHAAQTRFRAEVPNEEYWRRQIKCQYACPVHTDSRGYIRAIAAGDYEGAYLIARGGADQTPVYARLTTADRKAVQEILLDTRRGLPDYWK